MDIEKSCNNCSLGQNGKCDLDFEYKCMTFTGKERTNTTGDYWIDRDED